MSRTEFTPKEKKFIVKCLLTKINLTVKRGSVVKIRLNKFGTIHTHGNKRRMNKIKYLRRYNKASWNKKKKNDIISKEYLLW